MKKVSRRDALKGVSAIIGTTMVGSAINNAYAQQDPGPKQPETDHGSMPNLRFSFNDAYNRMQKGGWARQVTARELPVSTDMAGVNMKLDAGQTETGIRELHWHLQPEWSFMLKGSARITAIDQDGKNFVDDVKQGDLWFFPAGIPHSIQALQDGCEFLLVFDDGNFSEDDTFLITDWLAHTPKEVIAKNLGISEQQLQNLPTKERYIFPGPVPPELPKDKIADPAGDLQQKFSHHLSKIEAQKVPGGSVKITDTKTFPVSKAISSALVEVEPGGLRELHWHPDASEWQFYIEGEGRMTVFASGGKARTFDYKAYDVGYVPKAMGHYIENTGNSTLRFLEIFRSDHFTDVSLRQWMALTPPELVAAHLNLPESLIRSLPKEKPVVVKG